MNSTLRLPAFSASAEHRLSRVAPRHCAVSTVTAQLTAFSYGPTSCQHLNFQQQSVSHPTTSRSNYGRAAAAAPAAAAAATADGASQVEELRRAAVALAKIADDTKALDISVLHVEPVVSWTSYMVLCTVMSKPQLLAVLSRMEDAAAELGLEKQNSAGSSQWELLDFGSIVVHVFTADQREYYNLDDFYALAEEVELPFEGSHSLGYTGGRETDEQLFGGLDGSSSSSAGGQWSKSI